METRFLKKAVILTGFGCNSNCIFCLQDRRTPALFAKEKILKEISNRRMEGANWLVITGGEATIHPQFINFVAFGKKLGYERIQVISNGRMLSNEQFVRRAAAAGLTEATLSFHGSTSKKHDALVRVPGAFKEASQAANHCRKYGVKLSFNTALNSLNVLDLGEIAKYIHQGLGFEGVDYDIVGTAPSGGAWKHKLLPKHEDVKEGIRLACEYAEKNNLVVWLTRTPIQDMPEGYEYHKEPWEVLTHEALAMWNRVWCDEKSCDPLKCEFCEITPICFYIKNLRRRWDNLTYITGKPTDEKLSWASKLSDRFIIPELEDAKIVEKHGMSPNLLVVFDGLNFGLEQAESKLQDAKDAGIESRVEFRVNAKTIGHKIKSDIVYSPTNPYPYVKYSFEQSNKIVDLSDSMLKLDEALKLKGSWRNVPLCIKKGEERTYSINLDDFSDTGEILPRPFADRIIEDIRVFNWECENCSLQDKCPGFFGDYVKLFGFDEVTPQ